MENKIDGRLFKFSVDNKKIYFPYEEVWRNTMNNLQDGEYNIVIKKIRHNRTNNQNSYYWALLTILSMHTGHETEELHEHFKYRFLIKKEGLKFVQSTSILNTKEMTDYIDQIKRFSMEFLHCSLPNADEFELLANN